MFLFVLKILGIGFLFFVGWLAFSKPYQLIGYHGTPRQITKHIRQSRLVGVFIMICSVIMLICMLGEQFAGS